MSLRQAQIEAARQVLGQPVKKVEGTDLSTAYEVGLCYQLDGKHCLLAVSLDEQGAGDRVVGDDMFVFSKLEDIRPELAIPLNRIEPEGRLPDGRTAYLLKGGAYGGFLPLDEPTAGAGTGFLWTPCITFNQAANSITGDAEILFDFIQMRWDGETIQKVGVSRHTELLGVRLRGVPICPALRDGDTFLLPFTVDQGTVVFRFAFEGGAWRCREHGAPFGGDNKVFEPGYFAGEVEPTIRKAAGRYWIHTRGCDPFGRLYVSDDGLNYRLHHKAPKHTVPQVLNQGLDGELYLATNPFPQKPAVWIRNPLVLMPLGEQGYGEPVAAFDDRGIRQDDGDSLPFADHAVACNVMLEGRMRHLLWFRVCDLKERTAYAHQTDLAKLLGKPKQRQTTSGLYVVEVKYS